MAASLLPLAKPHRLLLLGALVAGCTFDPAAQGHKVACRAEGDCLPGHICANQHCQLPLCQTDAQRNCTCPDGSIGKQPCRADRTGWLPCSCPGIIPPEEEGGSAPEGEGDTRPVEDEGRPDVGEGEGEGQLVTGEGEDEGQPAEGEGEGPPGEGEGQPAQGEGEGEGRPVEGEGEGRPTEGEGEARPGEGEGEGAAECAGPAPLASFQQGVCLGTHQLCIPGEGVGWRDPTSVEAALSIPHYEAPEYSCDGLDNDCDGVVDEHCECQDGGIRPCGLSVGICQPGSQRCGGGRWLATCEGGVLPGEELCNGLDDDCDGLTDEDFPLLHCGEGDCANTVPACANGQPQSCVPRNPPTLTCDAPPAPCHTTTQGRDNCNRPCSKVGPAYCYTVHSACLTSQPGTPTDSPTCDTPRGRYNCGLSCQPWPNTIGADCTYCVNIHCRQRNGLDEAQFRCRNIPVLPTP